MKSKSTHGGARPGAGRPKEHRNPMLLTAYVERELVAALDSRRNAIRIPNAGGGNRQASRGYVITQALSGYLGLES